MTEEERNKEYFKHGHNRGMHRACAMQGVAYDLRPDRPATLPPGYHKCVVCGHYDQGERSVIYPLDYFIIRRA